jgi:hypothetical protein
MRVTWDLRTWARAWAWAWRSDDCCKRVVAASPAALFLSRSRWEVCWKKSWTAWLKVDAELLGWHLHGRSTSKFVIIPWDDPFEHLFYTLAVVACWLAAKPLGNF